MIINSKRFKKCISIGVLAILLLNFTGCSLSEQSKDSVENVVEEKVGGDVLDANSENISDLGCWQVNIEKIHNSSGTKVGSIIIQDEKISNDICEVTGKGSKDVKVNIDKKNKEILLTSDKQYINSSNDLKININVPVKSLTVVGGGYSLDINMKNSKDFSSKFMCAVEGSIDIKNADKIDLDFAGAGNLDLQGNAKDINIDCKGAGNIEAEDFETQNARVTLRGTGNCTLNVKESLDGTIHGLGSISYKGNPKNINKDIKGLGQITKM